MHNDHFIPYCLPDITHLEIEKVVETLQSGWLAKGPRTIEFEEKFAEYVGAKHAIAMNSCTAALHISLIAVGIGEGDEVITTSMTFAASVNTILHVGAIPVFVDIDKATGLIDVNCIEEKITERTKAIVPVHYSGQSCDLDEVYELANKYNLFVSEDAAHALYTEYKGRKIGNSPKGTVSYSFYATKNLATGEGGMLVTDNDEIAEKARILVTHGMSRNAWNRYAKDGSWKSDIEVPGYKYNMSDLEAALGIVQLSRLEEMQMKREKLADLYNKAISKMKYLEIPAISSYTTKHAWHLYLIKVNEEALFSRDDLIEFLKEKNVSTSVHFLPVHQMTAYKDFSLEVELPNTDKWADHVLSLPLYPTLSIENLTYIIEKLKEFEALFD